MIALKDFKTVNQRFKAGDAVTECDEFDAWKERGFIGEAQQTPTQQ